MAIVNNDRDVCIVYEYEAVNYALAKNAVSFYEVADQKQCTLRAKTEGKDGQKYTGKFVPSITNKVLKTIVSDKNKIRFELNSISKNPLDVDYVYKDSTDYTSVKYWSKTIIPSDFSLHLQSIYDLLFLFAISANSEYQTDLVDSIGNEINWFINNKVLFWGTFKENFLAGELIYILSQLKTTLLSKISDKVLVAYIKTFLVQNQQIISAKIIDARIGIITTMLEQLRIMSNNTMIKNFSNTFLEFFNEKNRMDWVETIFKNNDLYEKQTNKWILKDQYSDLQLTQDELSVNINSKIQKMFNFLEKVDPFTTKIQGAQFRQYGIGLGQFFICISLWIGAIVQTFAFRREKHKTNCGFFKNYFSKMILMLTTSSIQTTILLFTLLIPVMGMGSGFSILGFKIFCLLYLSALYVGFIYVLIVQSIWFAFKNLDFAKLVCFGYLLLNLTSGWGVFAPFMQASFFKWISYFVPFSYSMHLFSSIIYGVEVSQVIAFETGKEIIINSLMLLIWPLVFISLTFVANHFYTLKNEFGTYSLKRIFKIINDNKTSLDNDSKFTFLSLHRLKQKEQDNIKQIIEQENKLKQECKIKKRARSKE